MVRVYIDMYVHESARLTDESWREGKSMVEPLFIICAVSGECAALILMRKCCNAGFAAKIFSLTSDFAGTWWGERLLYAFHGIRVCVGIILK